MANLIALIIFIGSFIGLAFLIFRKISVLANLPEEPEGALQNPRLIKQNIIQKTSQIKQAVLHNVGVGKIKTVFANRVVVRTQEEMQKVEKIHQEGDYWLKVEEHKAPVNIGKKRGGRKPKMEIVQASAVESMEINEPQPATDLPAKKPRQPRKKKTE